MSSPLSSHVLRAFADEVEKISGLEIARRHPKTTALLGMLPIGYVAMEGTPQSKMIPRVYRGGGFKRGYQQPGALPGTRNTETLVF